MHFAATSTITAARSALGRLAMGLVLGLQAHAERHAEVEVEALPALAADRARLGPATRVALLPAGWHALIQQTVTPEVDAFTFGHQVMEAAAVHLSRHPGLSGMRDVVTLALHLAQLGGVEQSVLLTALRFHQRSAVAV